MQTREKIELSWADVKKFAVKAGSILSGYKKGFIKNIYGVRGGGQILAVLLSKQTGIPLLLEKTKISKGTVIAVDEYPDAELKKIEKTNRNRFTIVSLMTREKNKGLSLMYRKDKINIILPWNKK